MYLRSYTSHEVLSSSCLDEKQWQSSAQSYFDLPMSVREKYNKDDFYTLACLAVIIILLLV